MPGGWRVRATVAVLVLPPLLELLSFKRIERALAWLASHGSTPAPGDEAAADWVDRALAGKPHPWRHTCLRRATVLYYLLRAAGRPVDLCIGVRRDEHGELKAHAWLALTGAPYLEPGATLALLPSYTVISRFPASVAAA